LLARFVYDKVGATETLQLRRNGATAEVPVTLQPGT